MKTRTILRRNARVRKGLPSPGDVHINRPLTNMSVLYAQALDKFHADDLAPIMPSDERSNLYFIFTKDFWFRDEMKPRGVGAEAVDVGYGITTDSYACIPYAVRKPISDMVRANEDAPLNSDRAAMQFLVRLERIKREKLFVAACMATSKWATDLVGNTSTSNISGGTFKQFDQATSTPVEDVQAACTLMELKTGFRPNVWAMGQQVWDVLVNHAELIDRLKYGGQLVGTLAKVTPAMVAALMGLDEIVVLNAVENTAAEGATFSGSYIAGKNGLLMYRDRTAAIESVTAVRTFTWRRYLSADIGWRLKKYRLEQFESDFVEMQSAFVHKIVASDLGIFWSGMVA
jgi:hypothetical protein